MSRSKVRNNNHGYNLRIAARKGDLEAVKKHRAMGADVNSKSIGGTTPIMEAAEKDHRKIIEFLVKEGAGINQKNLAKRTALMFAAQHGNLDVVIYLLKNGADATCTDNEGKTARDFVSDKHPDIMRILESAENQRHIIEEARPVFERLMRRRRLGIRG